ncbi:MAG: hypothetical protein IKH15_09330 [Bacteroidales bacterium]|nr:hypothetical protein [Bacteroidales bacterium]
MDLIYTWAELKRVQDRIAEIEKMTDEITKERQKMGGNLDYMRETYNALWATRDKLETKRDMMRKQVIPEVGMPCTVHWYSDSSGAHVEKVISPKKIQVKCDGLYSCTKIFTYRKNGRWVEAGSTIRDWSTLLSLGYRHDYYDQSF